MQGAREQPHQQVLRRSVPGYVPSNSPLLRERDQRFGPLPEF